MRANSSQPHLACIITVLKSRHRIPCRTINQTSRSVIKIGMIRFKYLFMRAHRDTVELSKAVSGQNIHECFARPLSIVAWLKTSGFDNIAMPALFFLESQQLESDNMFLLHFALPAAKMDHLIAFQLAKDSHASTSCKPASF